MRFDWNRCHNMWSATYYKLMRFIITTRMPLLWRLRIIKMFSLAWHQALSLLKHDSRQLMLILISNIHTHVINAEIIFTSQFLIDGIIGSFNTAAWLSLILPIAPRFDLLIEKWSLNKRFHITMAANWICSHHQQQRWSVEFQANFFPSVNCHKWSCAPWLLGFLCALFQAAQI